MTNPRSLLPAASAPRPGTKWDPWSATASIAPALPGSLLFAPCSLLIWTPPDNSPLHFVRRTAQIGHDFRVEARVVADNSSANCRLGSSSRFATLAQTECSSRVASRPKKHVRTKRKKPRAPVRCVQGVRATAWTIRRWFVVRCQPIHLLTYSKKAASPRSCASWPLELMRWKATSQWLALSC
jgi:hypothetical protein